MTNDKACNWQFALALVLVASSYSAAHAADDPRILYPWEHQQIRDDAADRAPRLEDAKIRTRLLELQLEEAEANAVARKNKKQNMPKEKSDEVGDE